MKFRTRIVLAIGVISSFYLIALIVALSGMQHVKNRFENYLSHDQAALMAASNAYAQGLQMGQALRNIILDPKNPTAFRNFEQAKKDFESELKVVGSVSSNATENQLIQKISALRSRQASIQVKIIELAKTNQLGSIELLNKEETPLWREIKAGLLDFVGTKSKEVDAIKSQLFELTRNIYTASLALSLIAIIFGVGVTYLIVKRAQKQLGGEPGVAVNVAGKIAAGDLSVAIETNANDKESLLFALKGMRDNLSVIVSNIHTGASAIATSSNQIAGGNQDLSARNERQAAFVEETAASMQQLTTSVKQNLNDINHANQLALQSSNVASKSGYKVSDVIATMSAISESSRRIMDITSVIDGIAFQTNILALNAAVEAARAGEEGKGFAVVAGEVRHLAQRSATAAREIKDLIDDSVSKVALGNQQVNDAGVTIEEVVQSIHQVQRLMTTIDSSIKIQIEDIEVINKALSQIDEVTQQNAALVEQAAAAAESMRVQSNQLVHSVHVFQVAS